MPKYRKSDPKLAALREHGALHARPHDVADPAFLEHDFFDVRDLVQVKYEMVRRVEVDGDSISVAAAAFGFSRPSYYQARNALHRQGLAGLLPRKRGPKGAHKLTEDLLVFLQEVQGQEQLGAAALAMQLKERYGLTVHPRTIERGLAQLKKKRP